MGEQLPYLCYFLQVSPVQAADEHEHDNHRKGQETISLKMSVLSALVRNSGFIRTEIFLESVIRTIRLEP